MNILTWGQREHDTPATRLSKANLIVLNFSIATISLVYSIVVGIAGARALSLVLLGATVAHLTSFTILGITQRYPIYLRASTVIALSFTIGVRFVMRGYPVADGILIGGRVVPGSAALSGKRRATYLWCSIYGLLMAAFSVGDVLWPAAPPAIPSGLAAAIGPSIAITGMVIVVLMIFGLARGRKELATDLEREHARSETLLLNVLPPSIAERLKREPGVIAERFEETTVLFADIAGFTVLSSNMDPADIVRMLDRVFAEFDQLARKHGLEKIKTIGDAYMVAGGVPLPKPDHVHAVARMALDMLEAFSRCAPGLQLRIGMHTGPVVAGVIGREKFIYDLWGDTVNTASRMESHGVPGEVQVTERVASLLNGDFALEQRPPIHVKGKGEMTCYLLRRAT